MLIIIPRLHRGALQPRAVHTLSRGPGAYNAISTQGLEQERATELIRGVPLWRAHRIPPVTPGNHGWVLLLPSVCQLSPFSPAAPPASAAPSPAGRGRSCLRAPVPPPSPVHPALLFKQQQMDVFLAEQPCTKACYF